MRAPHDLQTSHKAPPPLNTFTLGIIGQHEFWQRSHPVNHIPVNTGDFTYILVKKKLLNQEGEIMGKRILLNHKYTNARLLLQDLSKGL